jgi:hypothetical protein
MGFSGAVNQINDTVYYVRGSVGISEIIVTCGRIRGHDRRSWNAGLYANGRARPLVLNTTFLNALRPMAVLCG